MVTKKLVNVVSGWSGGISKKRQEKVDERIIKKAEKYEKKKLMPSYKFKRVEKAEVDENKSRPAPKKRKGKKA